MSSPSSSSGTHTGNVAAAVTLPSTAFTPLCSSYKQELLVKLKGQDIQYDIKDDCPFCFEAGCRVRICFHPNQPVPFSSPQALVAQSSSDAARLRALEMRVSELVLESVTPSVLSHAMFRQTVLNTSGTWNSIIHPWWDEYIDFLHLSESNELKSFCHTPPAKHQHEVKHFQPFLMSNLQRVFQVVAVKDGVTYESCSFVDTSATPLAGTTRKPDVTLTPRHQPASVHNFVAIISIKKEKINENSEGLVELASMLQDLLFTTANRNLVVGCLTDCSTWIFVRVERLSPFQRKCSFQKTRAFQLLAETPENPMSVDRKVILSFFYQEPGRHGLPITLVKLLPYSSSTLDAFNAHLIARGGSSAVYLCEPTSLAQQINMFVVKQLTAGAQSHHLFQHEIEIINKLKQVNGLKQYIPTILFVDHCSAQFGMQPVGIKMTRKLLTKPLITQMIDYAVKLFEAGYVDWDMRDANIMLQPNGVDLLKVDLASVHPVQEVATYHGTVRFAYPLILLELMNSKHSHDAALSGIPAVPIQPQLEHSLFSLAASCIYWRQLNNSRRYSLKNAGINPAALFAAWKKIWEEDQFVSTAFDFARLHQAEQLKIHLHSIIKDDPALNIVDPQLT